MALDKAALSDESARLESERTRLREEKKAFLEAFNNAYDEYKGDEHRAFAVAHAAAKKAGAKPGPG